MLPFNLYIKNFTRNNSNEKTLNIVYDFKRILILEVYDNMRKPNEDFKGIYKNIADLLGEEATIKLYKNYKGQQITFPMRLYSKEYVLKVIKDKYNGKNLNELSRELDYSERWMRKLINQIE